jgi:cation transport regulator ChaB
MPYARNSELPPAVRDRYSERCQTVFRKAFNNAVSSQAGGSANESAAFRIAHSAANNCMESSKRSPLAMNAVKFAEGTDNIIEGLAIPFGGPFAGKDIQGEAFGPDTDLALEWFPEEGRPVIYHHGLDEGMKTALAGRQIARELRDVGHWVKVQLDKRNRYFEQISKMVNDGLLSFSSGSLGHLVEVEQESGKIKAWPWVELSLTPTPANPDAAVYAVKASDAIEHIAAVKSAVPAPLKAAVDVMEDGFTEQAQEGDSEPETLADHSQRVLAEVKAWVDRVEERASFRAKAGRELSKRNIETLREAHRIIGELLERADAPTKDEAEAAKAVAEYLRLEAAQLGAIPD